MMSRGDAAVLVFTFNGCGQPCEASVKELECRGVPFQELMVEPNDQSSPSCKRLRKELSGEGVDYVGVDVEESGEFDVMTQTLEIGG